MHEGTPNFEQIVKESPYLVVDGELPWGFWSAGCDPDSPSAGWIIDGMGAARRFFLQHYTSLSVIHNYKEQHPNRMFDEANAPEYSMIVWKKSMINADSLRKYHMPVSDHYFQKRMEHWFHVVFLIIFVTIWDIASNCRDWECRKR